MVCVCVCVCDANNMRLGGPASVVSRAEGERETRTADSEERLRKAIFEAEGHKRVRPVCSCDTRRGVVWRRGRGLDPPRPTALGRNNTHATQHIII